MSQSPAESHESESESSLLNLYIVHEPSRQGGPFGLFVDESEDTFFSAGLQSIAVFPGMIGLIEALHDDLKRWELGKDLPWYDLPLQDLLSEVGRAIDAELKKERRAHFAEMDIE